jgi:deazaflavin-dependent oxidoreductase (nitroreductase family)
VAAGQRSLTDSDLSIGDQLAGWGKVALIETIGRISGTPISTAVGFVEDPDGSLLLAAGVDSADWGLNLTAHPICRATIGDRVATYRAEVVAEGDRGDALTRLILKYGTPAERLGHGSVFRLTPVEA